MSDKYSGAAFRRSIIQYTGGRVLNALAGFAVFVLIARQLPEQQYANYVAAFAAQEICLIFSGFGMEWVTAVYLPQVRLKASGTELERFVWKSTAVQAGMLLTGASLFFAVAPGLAAWLGLEGAGEAFRIYALVMFVEGMSRVFREQFLSGLLLQRAAQASQFARHAAMLSLAYWMLQHEEWRTAKGVALAELSACACSLLLAAVCLYRYLVAERREPPGDPGWQRPRWPDMIRVGRNAWLSNLANLSWSGQMVILLVTRLIGADAGAALGFARNLSEQVRRYMPMEFMYGLMRTLLIARFAADGDRAKLGIRAGLMYKANLLFLLPLLVLVIARGDEVCVLLSAGRYENAHWLLVGWLSLLVLWAHRRPTDILAHALGRSGVTSRTSFMLLLALPALVAVVRLQEWPLLFLVLLIVEASYSGIVLAQIGSVPRTYQPHWAGLAKFGAAAVLAAGALSPEFLGRGLLPLLLAAVLAFVIVWVAVMVLRGWSEDEKALLPESLHRWILLKKGAQ